MLTMGAVLAPTHYRARVPIRGWATVQDWRPRLRKYGIQRNTYEGPTGIATVVSLAARDRSLPSVVLNASTPTYLASNANPRTSLALLRAVAAVYGVKLPLAGLEQTARGFSEQVDEYLAGQPELKTEIEALTQDAEEEVDLAAEPEPPDSGELPRSEDVVRELEAFLNELREQQGDNPSSA
jgi:hypothetical protein